MARRGPMSEAKRKREAAKREKRRAKLERQARRAEEKAQARDKQVEDKDNPPDSTREVRITPPGRGSTGIGDN